jgi:hypothetical protein
LNQTRLSLAVVVEAVVVAAAQSLHFQTQSRTFGFSQKDKKSNVGALVLVLLDF